MDRKTPQRIQETKTLFEILPSSSPSSGREFARIVNLLLFHDGRRNGRTVALFDDRAGDYKGFDAFEKEGETITVGYQHKFYASPLGDKQRKDIEDSLLKTIAALKEAKSRLGRWILVTPQDFVESATRKTGGDVTWFEGLREKHKLPIEIEHWGHTQLQALFIQTPSIGLYYYPEHFPDGAARRKTIQGIRAQYDDAIRKEHGRIEFVGMSVYKEEATRTVPMENIYIPLSVIANGADENAPDVPRRNPIEFLAPGTRHVVLGDPGSGKTTLLKFLALFGQSEALQRRYRNKEQGKPAEFARDGRLPIFVTLRRYADALKPNDNLPLIDYIRENIAADLSIAGVSIEFLEFYLESGQTILLFDGLDELPDPTFKQKIRNRIQNLAETYPGNTVIVSSRVFGYEGPVRFDDKQFEHHRLARLRMEEIEQFVRDWYQARLEKAHDRKEYLDSLLGILRPDGMVDSGRTRALVELARPLKVTFHRAFDMTCDPYRALDDLIGLGIERVLTAGQESSALEGVDLIADLVRRASGRILVMPGGGITERNIGRIVATTGAREVHVSGRTTVDGAMTYRNTSIFMGGVLRPPEFTRSVADAGRIREIQARARQAAD